MNILFITPYLPYPPISGGRLQTFLRIKNLKKIGHNVYLISIVDGDLSGRDVEDMKRYVTGLEVMRSRIDLSKLKYLFRKSLILEIFPYLSGFEEKIKSILKNKDIDITIYEGLGVAQYKRATNNIPSVIYEHNVEHEIVEQLVSYYRKYPLKLFKGEILRNIWLYVFGSREIDLARKFESVALSKFDLCITCSDRDADILKRMSGKTSILPIPWIIEIPEKINIPCKKDIYNLVFVGSMYWEPNKDAIMWFIKEVMPLLRESLKNIRLIVVGSFMSREIYKLNNNRDIFIRGFVKDISKVWLDTDIFIAPIRLGSGVNVKIIEAMSYGIPIITTSKGAEGLNASGGEHFLISDTPKEFFENIKCLIDNLEMRKSLSIKAREYISEYHEINKVIKIFEKALIDVSNRKA